MTAVWTWKTTPGLIVTLGRTVITTLLLWIGEIYAPTMDNMKKDETQDRKQDELAESLDGLFSSVSTMIKSELQVKHQILSSFPLWNPNSHLFNEHSVIWNGALLESPLWLFIYFCYNMTSFCVRGQIIT